MDNFTNGHAWENAFEFSKHLRDKYEAEYEYEKLCEILVCVQLKTKHSKKKTQIKLKIFFFSYF